MHVRARPWPGVVVALLLQASVTPAAAEPVLAAAGPSLVGGGGLDYYQGPGGETTRSAIAIAGVVSGDAVGTLSLTRSLDSVIGDGVGFGGSLLLPLDRDQSLCAWGSRFAGDDSLHAWRVKLGPLFKLAGGGTTGVYYSHAADDQGGHADAGTVELALPLRTGFTGRASAAYGSAPGGLRSALGSVGLAWAPGHGLELAGDVGVARNGALSTSPGPVQGPIARLLGRGGGGQTSADGRVDSLLHFGLRVLLP
jgi:hypothetical protein